MSCNLFEMYYSNGSNGHEACESIHVWTAEQVSIKFGKEIDCILGKDMATLCLCVLCCMWNPHIGGGYMVRYSASIREGGPGMDLKG